MYHRRLYLLKTMSKDVTFTLYSSPIKLNHRMEKSPRRSFPMRPFS
jgi:hypothetical protein